MVKALMGRLIATRTVDFQGLARSVRFQQLLAVITINLPLRKNAIEVCTMTIDGKSLLCSALLLKFGRYNLVRLSYLIYDCILPVHRSSSTKHFQVALCKSSQIDDVLKIDQAFLA